MHNKVFISYSHNDALLVTRFAQQLSLCGFDLWIDEKDIEIGGNYSTQIFTSIYSSDIYMVFLSKNSINSRWVNAEIDFALSRKIDSGKPIIVPVLLDDSEVPVSLTNIDFLDARFSINDAVAQFTNTFQSIGATNPSRVSIVNIGFTLSDTTDVEIGAFNEGVTRDDLVDNRTQLLESMRKNAYGLLMNFVSIADFDFDSSTPRFMNGIYTERIDTVGGSTEGSLRERVRIEATVFQPDEDKIHKLLTERLEILNINEITFGFSLPLTDGESMADIAKLCYQKLQRDYIILSYDNVEGAKVELTDDFYLSLCFSDEIVKIKLSTKYDWQFPKKMKEFSIWDFLQYLFK